MDAMLSNLRLRAKLLLLALGPILLLTIMLSGIAVYELRNLAEQQEEHTRQSLISDRRAELQNYVQLAAHGATLWDVAPSRVEKDLEQWRPLIEWAESA